MTAVDERSGATAGSDRELGRARRRKEDQRLITGRTRWTDNIVLPGMLHLAFVRSPYAHANITSIDTEAARSSSGVVAVLTGADLDTAQIGLPNAWAITPDQKAPHHPAMPTERVAFAGEAVAVVVARTAREARDAADLVDVEYDELPPVLDI
jgi:carbon-monoxide dehydrogenase large subunit